MAKSRRASTATRARLKALRRKHGLGEFKTTRRKVTTMAKKRAGFKKHSRRSGGFGGWIPLSNQDMILDFGIGMAVGPLSGFLKPYQDQYLGMFGQYSDEAALAIVGALAHKFGSGMIKDGGKELFRVAVISAGQGAGSQLLGGGAAPTGGLNAYSYN